MRPLASFIRTDFPPPAGPEDDAGFAMLDGEGDVFEDGLDVKGDGDVVECDDGLRSAVGLLACVRDRCWRGLRA